MISIIIPTFNEAGQIVQTINKVLAASNKVDIEIILVDGGSTDKTISLVQQCGVTVRKAPKKGRAAQMNTGAAVARYELLYFLHADTLPPEGFTENILGAVEKNITSGCFRLAFDHGHWFLTALAWLTRFDVNGIRFGDQSLFVSRNVFNLAGGFNEKLFLMEDQEIIHRIKKFGKFKVLPHFATTSARKYLDNGIFKTQLIFTCIWVMYYLGFSQAQMLKTYKKLIRKHKF